MAHGLSLLESLHDELGLVLSLLEGRMEYSPVSQISKLPVAWEADSIRWFWRVGQFRCRSVDSIFPSQSEV